MHKKFVAGVPDPDPNQVGVSGHGPSTKVCFYFWAVFCE